MNNTLQTDVRTKGDIRTPLAAVLMQGGKPVDLAGKTVNVIIETASGGAKQAATATGVSIHPTFTVVASATGARLTANDHRVTKGMQVVFATDGTLPSGLTAATRYFARDVEDNSFRVAATKDGHAIDLASAGSGNHTAFIVGSVTYTFTAGNLDTEGTFWLWFRVIESGNGDSFPHDGNKLKIDVVNGPNA